MPWRRSSWFSAWFHRKSCIWAAGSTIATMVKELNLPQQLRLANWLWDPLIFQWNLLFMHFAGIPLFNFCCVAFQANTRGEWNASEGWSAFDPAIFEKWVESSWLPLWWNSNHRTTTHAGLFADEKTSHASGCPHHPLFGDGFWWVYAFLHLHMCHESAFLLFNHLCSCVKQPNLLLLARTDPTALKIEAFFHSLFSEGQEPCSHSELLQRKG